MGMVGSDGLNRVDGDAMMSRGFMDHKPSNAF